MVSQVFPKGRRESGHAKAQRRLVFLFSITWDCIRGRQKRSSIRRSFALCSNPSDCSRPFPTFLPLFGPGARFSKVPIINGPVLKAVVVYMQDRGYSIFASNVIKLSVNETKWSSLLARTRAFILCISI